LRLLHLYNAAGLDVLGGESLKNTYYSLPCTHPV